MSLLAVACAYLLASTRTAASNLAVAFAMSPPSFSCAASVNSLRNVLAIVCACVFEVVE